MPIPLKLTIYKGQELISEELFERDIIKIGRLASAHLKLDDAKVSRIHAVLEASTDGQGYAIIDMGSTEGTYLNGAKVSKEKLKHGDQLRMGDCVVLVSLGEGVVEPANAPAAPSVGTDASGAPEALWRPDPQELAQATRTVDVDGLSGSLHPPSGESLGVSSDQVMYESPAPEGEPAQAAPVLDRQTTVVTESPAHPSTDPVAPLSHAQPTGHVPPPQSGQVPQMSPGPQSAQVPQMSPGPQSAQAPQMSPGPQSAQVPQMSPAPQSAQVPQMSPGPQSAQVPQMSPAPQSAQVPQMSPAPQSGQAPHMGPAPQSGQAPQMGYAPQSGQAPHMGYAPQASQASLSGRPGVPAAPSLSLESASSPEPVPPPMDPSLATVPVAVPAGLMASSTARPGAQPAPVDPWGSVPSNLASASVSDNARALEIKAMWGQTVLDTVSVTDRPVVTMGDERRVSGFGPFQKIVRCDLEIPSRGLPQKSYPLAEALGSGGGANYQINVPDSSDGRLERADGQVVLLGALRDRMEPSDVVASKAYLLQPAETLFLQHGHIVFQIRYVRRTGLIPVALFEKMNYAWMNILILAFFIHAVAIVSFVSTPNTQSDLTEELFKNPNRWAQIRRLAPPKNRPKPKSLLSQIKGEESGARARGKEGKAGKKNAKNKNGRMANKGDPSKKDLAKSTLAKIFGSRGSRRSFLFGTGGLGGELKAAVGSVQGRTIGDAEGLGGLGTRGSGPGGGGHSRDSVGVGSLGTRGRGGGGRGGYGDSAGRLGGKVEHEVTIRPGSPLIMGSLDKEIIRRVIKQHISQIRYCYERELQRTPGLFGKVATKFTISASGSVQSAQVSESTLKNRAVEQCITARIRTWKFPKPKGGGIVIVKYPFILKS